MEVIEEVRYRRELMPVRGWDSQHISYIRTKIAQIFPRRKLSRTITLPVEVWNVIEWVMETFCDEGPIDEGWRSEKLILAAEALKTALRGSRTHGGRPNTRSWGKECGCCLISGSALHVAMSSGCPALSPQSVAKSARVA